MRVGGVLACLLTGLVSCTHQPPHAPEAKRPGAVASVAPAPKTARAEPRLFPPTHGNGVTEAGQEHDGARRLLAFGLRVVERGDGSLEVGDELLPAARSARFLELPQRLGGGFLFWIVSSSGTLLYRSSSWTARLEPFAQLDFEVERLVPGFDRLLVLPRHDADYRALDLDTGQAVPPLGLPAAPAYGAMAFVDGWFGAVQVPLRGLLLSFDAGASWRALSLPVTSFEPAGDQLSLATSNGDYLLSARGALSRIADRDEAKITEAARAELARVVAARPAAERGSTSLLQSAALGGFPDGRGGALLASGGSLLRVALATGHVLERRDHAYVGGLDCPAVRFGSGVGFVCGQGQELTRIYRLVEPFELELVRELPGARVVSDSGSGQLVIHGGCSQAGSALDYCILRGDGSSADVRAASDRDRVAALADGRVLLLTPPQAQTPGQLTFWKAGALERRALQLPQLQRGDVRQKALLTSGVWLDGLVESKPGVVSGWLVGAGPFSGFELAQDGKLTLRRLQDNAAQALFAGSRALVLGDNGLAAESTDGGSEWQPVELPAEIDLKGSRGAGVRQGCSAVGCSFGGFTRIGYFDGRAARNLAAPATPPRVAFPGPGGSRWLLHCSPTGETSPPALPFRPPTPLSGRRMRRASGGPGDEIELGPLSPFLEQAAPALPENFDGVDAGTEPYGIQLRVYVYGPRGGDWSKAGALSIAFADRFSTNPGVRSTAAARSPWPDGATAADALGAEPSTNAAGLAAALDPGGLSGALMLSSRGTLDLFAFEAGRVPQHIPNVGRLGLTPRLSGVVRTKAGVFLGSYDETARLFRVYKLVGQDLDVVLETADIPPPRGANAELVRSASGDGLAIWVRSTGWYVHPIDLETGEVDAPYVVSPAQLSRMPEPCAPATEGFLLAGAVAPDPYADALGMSLRAFEGRFRVSALGVCLDALAAQGDTGRSGGAGGAKGAPIAGSVVARATGRPTVAVTLTERKPLGRRTTLRCSN